MKSLRKLMAVALVVAMTVVGAIGLSHSGSQYLADGIDPPVTPPPSSNSIRL